MRLISKMIAVLVVGFFLYSSTGFTQAARVKEYSIGESENFWKSQDEYDLDAAVNAVRERPESCPGCGCYQPGRPENSCHEKYLDTYKHEPVEMTIALGYEDNSDGLTDDQVQFGLIADLLTRTVCSAKDGACGFKQSPDDKELFFKKITGPDGNEKTVHIHLVTSSLTGDDRQNRGWLDGKYHKELDDAQKAKSQHARDAYLKCQSEGDVCTYIGHARGGGGPSFDPPLRIVAADGRVTEKPNLAWLKDHPIELNNLTNALIAKKSYPGGRTPAGPPALNGIFGCNGESVDNFAGPILAAAPNSGLILTDNKVDQGVALAQGFEMVDSTLAMRCQSDFVADVGILQTVIDPQTNKPLSDNPIIMHNYLKKDPPPWAPPAPVVDQSPDADPNLRTSPLTTAPTNDGGVQLEEDSADKTAESPNSTH
jgi:hypothetical protein